MFKKLSLTSLILGFVTVLCAGCASDTHYDSMTSMLVVDVPVSPYSEPTVKIYQRITFDRDLSQISSMHLQDAWLSSDSLFGEDAMAVIQSASIYLYQDEQLKTEPLFWLTTLDQLRRKNEAKMLEMEAGDLKDYVVDGTNAIIIGIELELDAYQAMNYRLNDYECVNTDVCQYELMLSMTFEMSD